jgi:CRISPR/Cas system CSM-associated protein Csm3 (group 7 of RAMP superfamily)
MSNNIYLIALPINFPEGVAPGDGKGLSNMLTIAKNGKDKPVLRGTAIAGVIRNAYCKAYSATDKAINKWFGREQVSGDSGFVGSIFKVDDTALDFHETIRTHNAINRHTGAVLKGGVYFMEALPPGTNGRIYAELDGKGLSKAECETFLKQLADLTSCGLFFGGNRNRGIGRAIIGALQYEIFDCEILDGYAAFLDARYILRKGDKFEFTKTIVKKNLENCFSLAVDLVVPRGEDFVIGYGKTMDYMLEPQWVNGTDGKKYWRIPGSSIRGIFRGWMTRLAKLDGELIRDSADAFYKKQHDITGENIGYGFAFGLERKDFQKNPLKIKDPLLALFGSLYAHGRIHFSDALALADDVKDKQTRMHVSVDRFSGGAIEGSLFENEVIAASKLKFQMTITLENASEKEIVWLFKTLKALHLGIISVGSSKSSGRLVIIDFSINDSGTFEGQISSFKSFLEANRE